MAAQRAGLTQALGPMKRSRLLSISICALLLVGCNTIHSISEQDQFRGIVGEEVKTVRPVLLWRLSKPWRFEPDIAFQLYDENSGGNSRGEWLPVGTTMTILEINRYLTSEAGPWVGVVGTVDSPTNGLVKFIYTWPSRGYALERAAWEGDQTPSSRPSRALR